LTFLPEFGKGSSEIQIYEKTAVPESFKTFNISILAIVDCALSTLGQKRFEGLNMLKELNVTKNKLQSLNGNEFSEDLHSLEVLNLKSNQISEIPSNEFTYLLSLKKVYLDENDLKTIDKKLFVNNVNLQIVSLSACYIDQLHFKTFSTLSMLQEINLSLNRLVSLDSELFRNNVNLITIDLSYNNLQEIESNIFEVTNKLISADFDGNSCVGWSIQSNIQTLNETLVKNCTVSDKTRVAWLNNVIAELKEETENLLKNSECSEPSNFNLEGSLSELEEETKKLESENQRLNFEKFRFSSKFPLFEKLSESNNTEQCSENFEKLQNEMNQMEENNENLKNENSNLRKKLDKCSKE
jgi:Leucine rich repeat